MENRERQQLELQANGISVVYQTMSNTTAFCFEYQGAKYIVLSSELKKDPTAEFWAIEHELEHIKQGALYHEGATDFEINKKERIVDDTLILKNRLIDQPQDTLPEEVKENIHQLLLRKGINTMKNKVALYCLRDNMSLMELSYRLGLSTAETMDIVQERAVIGLDTLDRLADIFNVSPLDLLK